MKNTISWKILTFLSIVLLFLSPVLNMYTIFGDKYLNIYVGYLAILIYASTKLQKKSNYIFNQSDHSSNRFYELKFPPELRNYFCYSVVITILCNLSGGNLINATLTVSLGIIIYIIYWNTFRSGLFIKSYIYIAIAAITFHFYQNFMKLTTGIGVSGVIPFLNTSQGLYENAVYSQMYIEDRFGSFFSEPSHLAQFLIPLFILLLFDETLTLRFKRLFTICVFVSLILTKSGTSMMLLAPVSIFFFVQVWHKYKNMRLWAFLASLLSLIVGIYVAHEFFSSEFGSFVQDRSSEVLTVSSDDIGTSGFIRMWRGYFVFADYNLLEMVFGNPNLADMIQHIYSSNMQLYLEDWALTYFSGIQHILLYNGFIGFILFFIYLKKLWCFNSVCGKCLIITFLVLMFIDSNHGGPRMALFLLLAQLQKNNYKECNV